MLSTGTLNLNRKESESMTLEELQVVITARTAPLQAQLATVNRQLSGLQANTSRSMSGVQNSVNRATAGVRSAASKLKTALIALGIGKVLKDSFDITRMYEANVQQINRLFGSYASAMDSWIKKNATMFGMARADAMKYASVYGNLLSGFLGSQSEMSTKTQELLKATTIVASSTGRSVADVSERIRSGLLGNTESIEDLGINVNVALLETTEAFKQLANGKSWEKLSFQTQQQIRLMAILEQASAKFGDSIQQNTNFQLMQLTANLKNVALNIGQAFMPIVSVVLPVLNSMALALSNTTARLAEFMNVLFGTNFTAGAGEVAQVGVGFDGAGDSAKAAGEEAEKAGKAAKNALASFDEVNTLSKNAGGGSETGATPTTAVPAGISQLETAASSLADRVKAELDKLKALFKDGFEIGFKSANLDKLKSELDKLKINLENLFNDSDIAEAAKDFINKLVKALGQTLGAFSSIGVTIATNLIGGLNNYLEDNADFIKEKIISIFDIYGDVYEKIAQLSTIFADIFSVFADENGQQVTGNIIGIFANAALNMAELGGKVARDFLGSIVKVLGDNKEYIKQALDNTLGSLASITDTLEKAVTDTGIAINNAYDEYIKPAYDNMASGWSKVVSSFLEVYNGQLSPVIDELCESIAATYEEYLKPAIEQTLTALGQVVENFSIMWNEHLAPFIGWLVETFGPTVSRIFDGMASSGLQNINEILEVINGFLEALNGVLKFMNGVFTQDWRKAWEGAREIFRGVFNSLVGIVKDPLNQIIDMVNQIINGLNRISINIPNIPGIPGAGTSFGMSIPNIPRLARGGIIDSPTIAMIGEAGKEVVVPLENTAFADKFATAVGNAVLTAMQFMNTGASNNSNETPAVFEIDGNEFARFIIPYIGSYIRRTGVRLEDA